MAWPCPDHPRACGANGGARHYAIGQHGSSPRVRGKLCGMRRSCAHLRIIPARAGQTAVCHHHERLPPDHPRACGANRMSDSMMADISGSSPRVRGKPDVKSVKDAKTRIIPARAGQTKNADVANRLSADHPRACGANVAGRHSTPSACGSSPRVRGKRPQPFHDAFRVRIIPARAGQTFMNWHEYFLTSDHPRACGANLGVTMAEIMPYGSSPRVRGKRTHISH